MNFLAGLGPCHVKKLPALPPPPGNPALANYTSSQTDQMKGRSQSGRGEQQSFKLLKVYSFSLFPATLLVLFSNIETAR